MSSPIEKALLASFLLSGAGVTSVIAWKFFNHEKAFPSSVNDFCQKELCYTTGMGYASFSALAIYLSGKLVGEAIVDFRN